MLDTVCDCAVCLHLTASLSASQKDHIYSNCKTIYDDCQKLISEVTEKVKGQLRPLLSRLSQVWRLCQTSENLRRACSTLDVVLGQVSMERSTVLRSLSVRVWVSLDLISLSRRIAELFVA